MKERKTSLRVYIFSVLIALAAGALGSVATYAGMEGYSMLRQPALTPPPFVFIIVWTVLYVLMGISAARIYLSDSPEKKRALIIYAVQLIVNIAWSVVFFAAGSPGAAFFVLLLLLALITAMVISFSRIDSIAAVLQLPYLIWVVFAGYLNLMVWLLNR